ncbi:MAG: hypothetical protein ACTSP4_14300 [Candidatus Hodarchaeales archaeon]
MVSIFHFVDSTYPAIVFRKLVIRNISSLSKRFLVKRQHIKSHNYPIQSVIMDTGSDQTILPILLKKKLSLQLNTEYRIVKGATGIGFLQDADSPVRIEITDINGNTVENTIVPAFITKIIPKVQIDQDGVMDSEKNVYDSVELAELGIQFEKHDNYSGKVSSQAFSKTFKQRLMIRKYSDFDIGLSRESEMLIGRDWQENFALTFQKKLVKITPVRKKG